MRERAPGVTTRLRQSTSLPHDDVGDYAISPELFHWESQNRTSTTSSVGRRYLEQQDRVTHVLLLVRETKANAWSGTQTYTCLGPGSYVSHTGNKPIASSPDFLCW
ncbi:MAG: DUF3427 domain-containing protein [Dermatophilaceae bacterium]|nr:DUF3427 domain-containing protein [Dermatophilaceae bacterium]